MARTPGEEVQELRSQLGAQSIIVEHLKEWIGELTVDRDELEGRLASQATQASLPAPAPANLPAPVVLRTMMWSLGIPEDTPPHQIAIRGADDENPRAFQMPGGVYTNSCTEARAAWQGVVIEEVVPFLRKFWDAADRNYLQDGDELEKEMGYLVDRLVPDWAKIDNELIAKQAADGALKLA